MLNDNTAVVTGGSRGIGRAIAVKLAGLGADIAIIATRDSDRAQDTIKTIEDMGRKARLYVCDISNIEAVNNAVSQIITDFG